MTRGWWAFVGPDAEWTFAGSGFEHTDPRGDDPRWDELFTRLRWNLGQQDYGHVRRGGQLVPVPCRAPGVPRDGCPRWPMWVEVQYAELRSGAEAVTDRTGTDPRAEVARFTTAFAAELARAEELIGHAPLMRWGLLRVDW